MTVPDLVPDPRPHSLGSRRLGLEGEEGGHGFDGKGRQRHLQVGAKSQIVDGAVLGLSLGHSTRFSLEEQGRLLCVRDWVLATMRRTWIYCRWKGRKPNHWLVTLLDRFDARLTQREIETARLILQGFSSKAIAQQLGISPETVKVHRRNLYHKLNVNGHGELFALVLRPR